MARNTRIWLRGLWTAFIGGISTAIVSEAFDPHDEIQWKKLGMVALASGSMSLFNYLRQSPLPPEEIVSETVISSKTTTTVVPDETK